MRKLILLLCLSVPCFAGLSHTIQWDVRTGGSNTNSGCFDPGVSVPGTDYSQQNSPQITYTDLVAAGSTFTSVLHPVSSAISGNCFTVTGGAGCTTGIFEVVSTSGTTATADRSMGTGTCTGVLGGSIQTIPYLLSVLNNSSQTANIQAGTYTITSNLTFQGFDYAKYIGYQTTHADGGTKPLITTATNSTSIGFVQDANGTFFDNISFSSTAGTPMNGLVKTNADGLLYIRNCTFSGFVIAIDGSATDGSNKITQLFIQNTEIGSGGTNSTGIDIAGLIYAYPGVYIHNQTSYGIHMPGTPGDVFADGMVLDSNGYGIYEAGGYGGQLVNSSISNSTHDAVYNHGASIAGWGSINSIYYNNGGWAFNFSNTTQLATVYANNAYGSNSSGNYTGITFLASQTANDVTLTANPFTSSSNFALNATAGGGAALKAAGFPGVSPAGTGYLDIGALQSAAAAGASIAAGGYVQ